MSPSKSKVTVSVQNGQGEVEIVDGAFRVVGGGAGSASSELLPGIYKARTRVGGERLEQLFEVPSDGKPFALTIPAVRFPSAIPLDGTTTSHEYHQKAVVDASAEPADDIGIGAGAKMFVIIRDPSTANFQNKSPAAQNRYERSFDGFKLYDSGHRLLADFDVGVTRDVGNGYALLNVHATPAPYVLTYERPYEPSVAVPIILTPGWQTQLFINVDVPADFSAPGRPMLRDRSVMMARMGEQFFPADRFMRLTEIARQGLEYGRSAVGEDSIRQLLNQKFSNPILGLLVAHVLLLDEKVDLDLLRIVAANLTGMLGARFPDVVALEVALAVRSGGPVREVTDLAFPPLLRASWSLLRAHAEVWDKAFLRRIAEEVVANGIWMSWRPSLGTWSPPWTSEGGPSDNFDLLQHWPAAFNLSAEASAGEGGGGGGGEAEFERDKDAKTKSQKHSVRRKPQSELALEALAKLTTAVDWEALTKYPLKKAALARSLSELQRGLLPTILMFGQQLDAKDEVTTDDVLNLAAGYGVPMRVLAESLDDLLFKALAHTITHIPEAQLAEPESEGQSQGA